MFRDKESFKQAFLKTMNETAGITLEEGNLWDQYIALVTLLKESISASRARMSENEQAQLKHVYYFSMEFLIGRLLNVYLVNLGISDIVRAGLHDLGIDLDRLLGMESDPGLGNGGLGRLAACFLDSMAFLGIPGNGNGIRYQYGLFEQKIKNGYQWELADNWLKNGYAWETRKPNKSVEVKFKGYVRMESRDGKLLFYHEDYEPVLAVPYDIPVISFDYSFINKLRLWSAELLMCDPDFDAFCRRDFKQAIGYKSEVEAISYLLYPDDSSRAGKELRLKQEYFFVAAGLASIIRYHKKCDDSLRNLARQVAIHINDTHPVLCIPEMMRILMDEEGMGWEQAWNITVNTMSFTNHTIMPEAMEKWPADLFRCLLPRIFMIVEEIDRRFQENLRRRYPDSPDLLENTRIIKDGQVHMANLAVIGCSSVNGVAALHTEILKKEVFKDFYRIFSYKFNNKTNGVNHRRFLLAANPGLADLITKVIGPQWKKDAFELSKLKAFREDPAFLEKLAQVKYANKSRLAAHIKEKQGLDLDPSSLFDVQVKRIHAYKRQLLNILKVMYLYNKELNEPGTLKIPQTFIFGGKAAPSYAYAKTIIKLVNTLAEKINRDPKVNSLLKVAFLENFNVSLAEMIYPAADISEQISTAGKEASGTGNMKFMMNGAITLGTLDGANVEIKEAIGEENIFIFGLTADQVLNYIHNGGYKSWDEYYLNPVIKTCVDQLVNGFFDEPGEEFRQIYDSLLMYGDEFFVLKDFNPYIETYEKLLTIYPDPKRWQGISLHNIVELGRFSSDRAIREYAEHIWKIQ